MLSGSAAQPFWRIPETGSLFCGAEIRFRFPSSIRDRTTSGRTPAWQSIRPVKSGRISVLTSKVNQFDFVFYQLFMLSEN